MHIRRAEACDHGRIGSILTSAYEPVMQRMQPAEASEFAARLPDVVSRYAETGVWLLAEQNDPVGTVAFFAPGTTKHPLFPGNVAHIQLLGVLPSCRRAGAARALMAECLAMTAASGASELHLQTSSLMIEARSFYESLGFAVLKELPPVWGAPTFLYALKAPMAS